MVHIVRAQADLAKLVGVRRETIGNLEKGRYNPSLVLAWNIAEVFGVAIEEIFTLEDETVGDTTGRNDSLSGR